MRIRAILIAAFSVICNVMLVCIVVQPAFAATPAGSSPQSSPGYTKVTEAQLPDAICAQLKANLPQYASNPDLCTVTHTELSTGFTATPRTSLATTSSICPSGTTSFQDADWQAATLIWSLQLNTSWRWNGDCKAPTLTGEDCHVNFYIWPVTGFTSRTCTQYTTTIPSRAAYHHELLEFVGGGFGVGMRRECYGGASPFFNCNWTTGYF